MVRRAPPLLVLAMVGFLAAEPCRAQDLPPAPVPVIAATPSAPPPAAAPPPATLPAPASPPLPMVPPPGFYYEEINGPYLRHDPVADTPFGASGLFAALESDIVGVHFKNRLTGPVNITGVADTVHVPGADLDWTAAPRLELGYRMPQGMGEFLISYRSLATEGTGTIPQFDIDGEDGFLKSRLDVNVIDFDYANYVNGLGPCWDLKWKVGVRWASAYYDSVAAGPFLVQGVKNDLLGAGPHAGVDLWRRFPAAPGLEWFARLESAAIIGAVRQRFDEALAVGDVGPVGGETDVRRTQVAPVVNFETGLSWAPRGSRRVRFSSGYEWEYWWNLGRAGGSQAELGDQGVFLRAEFHY